jgi:hypothetical protein
MILGLDTAKDGSPWSVYDMTATYVAAADVLSDVVVGAVTGTYEAPDRSVVLTTANYGDGEATTGTYHAPDADEVLLTAELGVGGQGTYVVVDPDNVRYGTEFGPSSGGAPNGIYGGNMTLPAVGDVEFGVHYGTDGTELEGEYTGPAAGDVADAVWAYASRSLTA